MSKQAASGIEWTCPECGREYRLSAKKQPPVVCKQCVRRREKSQAREGKPEPIPPVLEPPALEPQPTQSATAVPLASDGVLPVAVESEIARQERQRLLADVANISRTMTFFRRLVFGMVIVMVLNVVLMGAAFFYSMQQLSSLAGGDPNQVPAGQPQLGNPVDQLKQIQNNLGEMNDVLKDLEGGR
ncbi:MAG: hypothetical protein AB8G99_22440 [Planctomycetaceae bacterium]